MSKPNRIEDGARLTGLISANLPFSPANQPITFGPFDEDQSRETNSGIKILHRSTVYTHPASDPYDRKNLYGFNHAASVISLPDGRLFAAWFSGPFEASVHQLILASYSSDLGLTWTAAEVFQDFPRTSDFDPAFIADGKRTWFFFSVGRWNRYPRVKDEQNEVGDNSFKVYERHSDDSGRTWSKPEVIYQNAGAGCRSNGIKLSTGELILPVHGYLKNPVAGVLKSIDEGRTWKRYGEISTSTVAHEPSCAELSTGEIMMVLRTGDGVLWRALSKDKGESWSPAEKTDIVAVRSSHNLFRLPDGRILLTHNPSATVRTPLTMRISEDDGKTWGDPTVLAQVQSPARDGVASREVSYPSVTRLNDGTLIVVWGELYISNDEQYGDIHSARVRV